MSHIAAPYKRYNGGKSGNGCYQQIINHIPPIKCYIEPFVGNGGIFRRLRLPALTVVNDIDRSVTEKYKHLRSKQLIVWNENALDLLAEISANALWEGILSKYDSSVLIYCDPPYRFSSRKSRKPLYKFEMTDADHEKFLQLVLTCKCNVMISHYLDKFYDDFLKGWNTHDFKAMTHAGLVDERIYYNYPKPVLLQDYRYIGNDYREREIIKRKTNRWIKRLHTMPELQRISILSAVTGTFADTAEQLINHRK